MSNLSREFKVGVFALLALGLFVYFVLRTDDRETSLFRKPVTLSAEVDSVEGVQTGTAVEIAGVSIGSVQSITLSAAGRARVVMEIQPQYKLPVDTTMAMKTRGLLGDRFIQLVPGTAPEILPSGGEITHFDKGIDVDALSKRADDISKDIAIITEGLKVLVGDEDNKNTVERILANLDSLSSQLPTMATATQRDLDAVVRQISTLSEQVKGLVENTNAVINRTGTGIEAQMAELTALTKKLDKALGDVNAITGRVERGEGTVGRLLNDQALIDQIEETVTDVQDLVGTVGRLQSTVGYRGEAFLTGNPTYQGASRHALEFSIMPREDYGYLLEVVSDPAGSISDQDVTWYGQSPNGGSAPLEDPAVYHEVRRVDDFLWTFQLQKRWNDVNLRFGIKYGSGGVGADWLLMEDRLALKADVFDFRAGQFPNLKLQAQLTFLRSLYVGVGLDDTLNGVDGTLRQFDSLRGTSWGPNAFVGAGFSFQDDDLKLLLTQLPISF